MKRTTCLVAAVAMMLALGCTSGSDAPPDDDLLFEVPDPPEGGLQIVGKKFTVPPGEERFVCFEVEAPIAEDIFIDESKVFQMDGGHHVIVFYTTGNTPRDPEPHECDDSDMTDVRLVGTGSGYGSGVEIPEGKGLFIPKGARLFFQSHYLNLENEAVEVQDAVNFRVVDPSLIDAQVGSFAHVDLTFALPAGQDTTRTMRCEIPFEMHPTNLFPHMHEWGHHFRAHIERGDERINLFDVDWDVGFRDDFPDFENPETLVFQQGDILQTECTWRNIESETLLFPREMCVTFFLFYPSPNGALLSCDEFGNLDEV